MAQSKIFILKKNEMNCAMTTENDILYEMKWNALKIYKTNSFTVLSCGVRSLWPCPHKNRSWGTNPTNQSSQS